VVNGHQALLAIVEFNGDVDIAAWIAAGAAAGTFALEPVLNLVRNGRRARAHAQLDRLADTLEKAERLGVSSPHLAAAIDEAAKVVRDQIVVGELAYAIRKGRKSGALRRMTWLTFPLTIPALLFGTAGMQLDRVQQVVLDVAIVATVGVLVAIALFGVWVELEISMAARAFVDDEDAELPRTLLDGVDVKALRRPPAPQEEAAAAAQGEAPAKATP
jgi:hypothetical protein